MQLFEPALPDTIFPEFDNLTLVAPPLGDEAIRV
jgi:D-threo-aldose 1-dehydrogenase